MPTPKHVSQEFTLLGKRFSGGSRAIPLKDHPCLTATAEALPELLKHAEDRSLSGCSLEVLLVAARWFQSDREGLLAWLEASWKPQPLNAIVSRWLAKEDPVAARESLDPKRDRWDNDLVDALALEDPAKSFEIGDQAYRLRRIFKSWARKDFAAAEKAAKGAKHWQQRYAVEGLAQMKASASPFEEAFAWASAFEVLPEIAMGTVIDRLAKTDLEAALRHLSEAGISTSHHMANTQLALGRLPIEEAADLLARHPTRLFSLFRGLEGLPRDPVEAARLLGPLAQEIERVDLPNGWHPETEDISRALAYLLNAPDNAARRALLEASLRYWSRDHRDLVSDFITSIPDPMRQSKYAQEFGGRDLGMVNLIDKELLGNDLNVALVYHRVREAIQSMTHIDPHRAEAAAAAIEEPAWRAIAHQTLFNGWAEHDEAAALEWAYSLPLSERQAAELDEHIENLKRAQP